MRTIYSHLSLHEFLSVVESKLGKSPIIDELYSRIDLEETRREEINLLEEQVDELLKKLDEGKSQTDLDTFCTVCEAPA